MKLLEIWHKIFSYRKLFLFLNVCLGITAVVIPPGLVIYHRWLMHPSFADAFSLAWNVTPFIKQLSLPTYFLIIFPLFIISIYIFVLLALTEKSNLPERVTEITDSGKPLSDIPNWQKNTSKILFIIAGICLVADTAASIIRQTIPGIELLGTALLFIFGLILKETGPTQIKYFLAKHAGWVVVYLAIYSVILVLLQNLFGEKSDQLGAGVILVLLLSVIMIRWYRRIPVILWISLGALILYAVGLDSWRFSVIGDEHDFYTYARYIQSEPVSHIARDFFSATGVFGTHTYMVSLVQAVYMKVFGVSNFGWRISNPVFLSAAVVCFYLFFHKFTRQSIALIISGLLACSSYLINFGKIGYDNPQAFFMLGLTLWLAAEAVFSRHPVVYAVLGMSMGFCLYSYPAALYILPLPLLLMAIYDFPKNKAAFSRWLSCIGMFCIIAIPLFFQPSYAQGKVEGWYIYNTAAIAQYGTGFMFGSQLVYSLFSYLYVINESHYVTSSHIDPISAIWVPIGLAWLMVQLRKNKFALFWIISFGVMWFLAGASHGRQFPPNTRMIMLLPWWISFTAFGISWMVEYIQKKKKPFLNYKALLAVVMVIIFVTNLVQVTWVFPHSYAGASSLEVLFLRLAQRGDRDPESNNPTYVFITDEKWGIDGIRLLQDLYHSPRSDLQLERIAMVDDTLGASQLERLQAENTIVILQPWLKEEWQASIAPIMAETGKMACPIRETVDSFLMITSYFPSSLAYLCPFDGNWSD
jgi:hypothetical protein